MSTYLMVFTCALLISLLATPLVTLLARRIGAVDRPGARKVHRKAIPRIGGLAIVTAMLAGFLPWVILNGQLQPELMRNWPQLTALLLASLGIFVVGLIDDLKILRARVKFLAQIAAAASLAAMGIRIEQIRLLSWLPLDLGLLAWPITLLWIVGITNAVNLIDGLDGLAAGISAVACGVIFILAAYSGQALLAVLMLALLGSLSGFLFFNFNPARIFMGDCGSTFLGFILASTSVLFVAKTQMVVALTLPAVALGVPIFDTLFSMLRRVLERRGMMSPDRSHLHHRLLDMGLRQKHVVILLYVLTLGVSGLGMFMVIARDGYTLIIFACVVMLLLAIFRFVGVVSVHKVVTGLKHNYEIAQKARHDREAFEHSEIAVRQADSFDEWWAAVCSAAREMEIARVDLEIEDDQGNSRSLVFENPSEEEVIRLTVPLPRGWAGPKLHIEMDVPVHGSLEAAGRRVSLFGRLLEENTAPFQRPLGQRDNTTTPGLERLTE